MRTPTVLAAALTLVAHAAPLAAQADSTALLARARRLHAQYPLVDGHNDLPWEIRNQRRSERTWNRMDPNRPLPGNQHRRERAPEEGGVGSFSGAPTFRLRPWPRGTAPPAMTLEQIDVIHRMVAAIPTSFEMAGTADDPPHPQERQDRLADRRRGRPLDRQLARRAAHITAWASAT